MSLSDPARLGSERAAPLWVGMGICVALLAVWAHLARIAELPMGFYVDESSIGWNAWAIATTGRDEHGAAWPLFFEAFGEYKNPVYIYLLAALYKVLGYSEWTTRFASFICWAVGSGLLFDLGRRLFRDPATRVYLLLCLGFTPMLFGIARVSFELVALYPLMALHLWAVFRGYDRSASTWLAALAGGALGLGLYAYSSFRLLAPLHLLAVLVCYAPRIYWRRHAALLAAFGVTVLPYALFLLDGAERSTSRFLMLTYLFTDTLPWHEKLWMGLTRYFGYFSPSFLLLDGDPNLRHHSGFGGALLWPQALLFAGGLMTLVAARRFDASRFALLVLAGIVIAPLAAALTLDVHHSLRVFSLTWFAILASAWAMHWLLHRQHALAVALLLATSANAALYVRHYFVDYPAQSGLAFENFGFAAALQRAIDIGAERVLIDTSDHRPYISLLFFRDMLENPNHVALELGERATARDGDVVVFRDRDLEHRDPAQGLPELSLYSIDTSRFLPATH